MDLCGLGLYYNRKKQLTQKRSLLWGFVFAIGFVMVANQSGWIAAEVGRQPWTVHPPVVWNEAGDDLVTAADGLYQYDESLGLRTSKSFSAAVSRQEAKTSLILFAILYAALTAVWITVLDRKIRTGPEPLPTATGSEGSGVLQAATDRQHSRLSAEQRSRRCLVSPEFLCIIWFVILNVLLIGYAILDGFDLGVGILHPFVAKTDPERRLVMNSIGPLWDGNEVWLVTFGGALFAMFPNAYASIFSAFYIPFVLLLFALIFRAVSLEFRSKRTSPFWRGFWDILFFVGSTLATFLFGVAVGAVMQGLQLSELGDYQGTLFDMLSGFSMSVGLFTVALLAMHGSIYLYMKTEGELQQRLFGWMKGTYVSTRECL